MKYDIEKFLDSDLGTNVYHFDSIIKKFKNGTFVDLGVRSGVSSSIMLFDAIVNNNKVYGVDVDKTHINKEVIDHPNYTFLLGDSVTIGKKWNNGYIDVLFIDTFHIKEQVLCELYYWIKHMKRESYIILHDCNWPNGKYDVYGGIRWDRVEDGIKEYFNIPSLNNNNNDIKSILLPDSWGMCIIKLMKDSYYSNINWVEIFRKRNTLINLFWNKTNIGDRDIELNMEIV